MRWFPQVEQSTLFAFYIESKMMNLQLLLSQNIFWWSVFGGWGSFYQDLDFLGCRFSGRCAWTFWPKISMTLTFWICRPSGTLKPTRGLTLHHFHPFFGWETKSFTLRHTYLSPFTASNCRVQTPLVLLLVRLGGWLLLIWLLQRLKFPGMVNMLGRIAKGCFWSFKI